MRAAARRKRDQVDGRAFAELADPDLVRGGAIERESTERRQGRDRGLQIAFVGISQRAVEALFAAYNAGPARYADYLAGRGGLPVETRAYLAKVTGSGTPVRFQPSVPATIFVLRHDRDNSNPLADRAQPAPLFAIPEAPR